ncbi:MAG TPA: inorganic phosphate transporter [Candidatus Brevibacterium intestinigallinarum]|nr:inorganic phosphate transporter [Candidatus Brevibacterium intestinigallinarum]
MEILFLVAVLTTAGFAFVNGFHDAGVTVGNAVRSRALSPRIALLMAGTFNFVGALMGQGVALTVAENTITLPHEPHRLLLVIVAGLGGAVAWGIVTYIAALPVSSTYTLVGGLLGAGLVYGAVADFSNVVVRLILPLLIAPVVVLVMSALVTLVVTRLAENAAPKPLFRNARAADAIVTGILALGHGVQDAQKSAAILMIAVLAYQGIDFVDGESTDVTWPVRLLIAAALALGTVTSGWRVMRTVAVRLVSLDPLKSVLANGVAATATLAAAFAVAVPVSIVYSVTAANVGTQFSGRRGVVRLRFLLPIVATALLAIPVPALLSAGFAWILLVAGV